jgi:thiol-disulfide isomerase/thioredoxin
MKPEDAVLIAITVVIVLWLLWSFKKREPMCTSCERMTGNPQQLADDLAKLFPGENNPVIVFYGTEWCHFCKDLKPVWEQLKKQKPAHVRMEYIDGDKTKLSGVSGFPTLIKYRMGKAEVHSGPRDLITLSRWVV